jgi:hypothetical protein
MPELNSKLSALKSSAPQLARILGATAPAGACWLAKDLPDLLRHQWGAVIDFDLAEVPCEHRDKTLISAAQSRIRTFGDLLLHPSPPLALLKLGKDFFKDKARGSKDQHPERQVAYLFYLLVILAARTRLGETISKLSEAELERGIEWSLGQAWLQGEVRELMAEFSRTTSRIE